MQNSLSKAPLCKSTPKHPKSAPEKALVSKDHLVRAHLGLGRPPVRVFPFIKVVPFTKGFPFINAFPFIKAFPFNGQNIYQVPRRGGPRPRLR